MHTVTKQYRDFPAAHRQPNHPGHCRFIHGHNWGWDIVFHAAQLDACGFVVDVGALGVVKKFLTDNFDHTLLLNHDDPYLGQFKHFLDDPKDAQFAKIVTVPNCGMEGLAKFVLEQANVLLSNYYPEDVTKRGLRVVAVVCLEDSKNSATYHSV